MFVNKINMTVCVKECMRVILYIRCQNCTGWMSSDACYIWWNRSNNPYYLRLCIKVWFVSILIPHLFKCVSPESRPDRGDQLIGFWCFALMIKIQLFIQFFSVASVCIRPTWIASQHPAPYSRLHENFSFLRHVVCKLTSSARYGARLFTIA